MRKAGETPGGIEGVGLNDAVRIGAADEASGLVVVVAHLARGPVHLIGETAEGVVTVRERVIAGIGDADDAAEGVKAVVHRLAVGINDAGHAVKRVVGEAGGGHGHAVHAADDDAGIVVVVVGVGVLASGAQRERGHAAGGIVIPRAESQVGIALGFEAQKLVVGVLPLEVVLIALQRALVARAVGHHVMAVEGVGDVGDVGVAVVSVKPLEVFGVHPFRQPSASVVLVLRREAVGSGDGFDASSRVEGGALGVAQRIGFGDDAVEAVKGFGPALAEHVEQGDGIAVGVVLVGDAVAERIGNGNETIGGVVEVCGRVAERIGGAVGFAARGEGEKPDAADAVGGGDALIGGIVSVTGEHVLAVGLGKEIAVGVLLTGEGAVERISGLNRVAVQVVGEGSRVVERIDFGEFPTHVVDDKLPGVVGRVGAGDEKTVCVVSEWRRVAVGVGGREHEAVRGIGVTNERAEGVGVIGQIAASVVGVRIRPVERIDFLNGLVEKGVERPARDFTKRVGAGDDIGAGVVTEGGCPTERFGDGDADCRSCRRCSW